MPMFAYMRDGRRVDMHDAVTVSHRDRVVFYDRYGQVVQELEPEQMIAYGRVLYDENDNVVRDDRPFIIRQNISPSQEHVREERPAREGPRRRTSRTH